MAAVGLVSFIYADQSVRVRSGALALVSKASVGLVSFTLLRSTTRSFAPGRAIARTRWLKGAKVLVVRKLLLDWYPSDC